MAQNDASGPIHKILDGITTISEPMGSQSQKMYSFSKAVDFGSMVLRNVRPPLKNEKETEDDFT